MHPDQERPAAGGRQDLEAFGRAVAHLRAALVHAGWEVDANISRMGNDLAARKGSRRVDFSLKWVREPRRSLLQAMLADAILRGRARAGARGEFVAVVGAPQVSEAMGRALHRYVEEVAPDQPFGYIDARGLVRLWGPGLESAQREPDQVAQLEESASSQLRDPFSDRNQWLLKALVGRRLPEGLLSAPRAPSWSAARLAAEAGVSAPAAWRLFASLRADGHLDRRGEVIRVPDLLARWRAAALRPQRQLGAVWIMPGRNPRQRMMEALAEQARVAGGRPACLGLFAACDALALGHVRGAPLHVYVRKAEARLLENLGLAPAPSSQAADVHVRVARWPQSVFRGAVLRDGVPVADVIQCWLDVSAEPTRGKEQASFLWRRVLGPQLAGGAPEP